MGKIPWWRLFIIFIAYLLVGAVLGMFFRFFGIPYQWTFFLALPVVATGVYIYFNHQRTETWGLLLCGTIAATALIGIARGTLVDEPSTPDGYPPNILDNCVIQDNIAYCYGYNTDNRIPYAAEGDLYLNSAYMQIGTAYLLAEIEFEPIETLGGLWGLAGGEGAMTGDQRGVLLVDESLNPMVGEDGSGLVTVLDAGLQTAQPVMTVRMPFRYDPSGVDEVTITAQATVVYRDATGQAQTVTLSRRANVVARDMTTIELGRNFNDYFETRDAVERFPTIPGMIAVVVVAAGAMVWLVRLGALVSPDRGDVVALRLQRQNAGLERLGVAVLTLFDAGIDVEQGDLEGLYVEEVDPRGPARKAGIRRGDILVSFNGRAVRTREQLGWAVVRLDRGTEAPVQIRRNSDRLDMVVKV